MSARDSRGIRLGGTELQDLILRHSPSCSENELDGRLIALLQPKGCLHQGHPHHRCLRTEEGTRATAEKEEGSSSCLRAYGNPTVCQSDRKKCPVRARRQLIDAVRNGFVRQKELRVPENNFARAV